MTAPRKTLTHETLTASLTYDPETGVFTRRGKTIALGSKDKAGYLTIELAGRKYRAHRLAWFYCFGEMPNSIIDHVNGITSDNRICNLRLADAAKNAWNIGRRRTNKSGYTGVFFRARYGTFEARIRHNGSKYHLGSFARAKDAYLAYCSAAVRLRGDFVHESILTFLKSASRLTQIASREAQ